MNKKIITFGIIVILAVIGVSYFGKNNDKEVSGEPIRIGALFPLTGTVATWGEASKNAAEIAVDEINKNGGIDGKPLVIDYQDHRCDPKTALSIFQQVSISTKVFISSSCSGTVLSIAPNLEQSQSILLANVVASTKISDASPSLFRNWPVETNQAEIIGKEIRKAGYKKVAVLNEDTDYAKGLRIALEDFLKTEGVQVISESFATGATDVRTQLAKLEQLNPDILFVSVQSEASGKVVLSQMEQLGFVPKKMAVNDIILNAQALVVAHKGTLEGAISVNYVVSESDRTPKVFEEYKKRYGSDCPHQNACAAVYDSVYMLAEAIEKEGYSADKIADYLSKINYSGAGGTIGFNESHDRKDVNYSLFVFKNGIAELVK